ncbi:L,D-transpeptidase family protein [Deefgea tanakiae]|uniref:L,D-transpeptidase family protein n=1 Tax=Deefgea tanakiae TaxID=2865840 RepID=A0ABX8Z775_9NEIS|nr:L,D-transpeptidase family protein [Deefgea tanakiae]QZA78444.1 L,D-transpeptidase family protein [Deefgea tanakiae]
MSHLTPWTKRIICLVILLCLATAATPRLFEFNDNTFSLTPEITGTAKTGNNETRILAAIDDIRSGNMADARATVDALLDEQPNYRLAQLLRADLYAMRAMPLETIGGGVASAPGDALDDLRKEALVRIAHRNEDQATANKLPANIVVFAPNQKYAILVDASTSRLYVFANENGKPKRIKDHYVVVGKLGVDKKFEGDQRSPLGVYFVTSHLTRPQLDKTYGALADLYGVGAWPISYPNELDRSQKRTGYGIWLHGSPAATYARAPQASNGCVVLTNEEMLKVSSYLQPGNTPVIVAPQVEWLSESEWLQRQTAALALLSEWKSKWESLDANTYLNFYGAEFRSAEGQTLDAWRNQKTTVNTGKTWTKIQLSDISIFAAGENSTQLVTTFKQDYRSNNLENQMRKRLYWQRSEQGWKIIWEGAAAI